MKRVYKLSESGKLIYKAALEGKRLSIITCMHMLNSVAVIPSSVDKIVMNTEVPNMAEEDKEEYSYIMVSDDIKSTPKNTYLDYKSTHEDFD